MSVDNKVVTIGAVAVFALGGTVGFALSSGSASGEESSDLSYLALKIENEKLQAENALLNDDPSFGPGVYKVTEVVKPGRYRTVNSVTGSCYMSQDRGGEIINNILEDGERPIFIVQDLPGTTFNIGVDCGSVEPV